MPFVYLRFSRRGRGDRCTGWNTSRALWMAAHIYPLKVSCRYQREMRNNAGAELKAAAWACARRKAALVSGFLRNGVRITGSRLKNNGYVRDSTAGATTCSSVTGISTGEADLGLARRFTPRLWCATVRRWNLDEAAAPAPSNRTIPFYITNRGYGVLVNHPQWRVIVYEVALKGLQSSVQRRYLQVLYVIDDRPRKAC